MTQYVQQSREINFSKSPSRQVCPVARKRCIAAVMVVLEISFLIAICAVSSAPTHICGDFPPIQFSPLPYPGFIQNP